MLYYIEPFLSSTCTFGLFHGTKKEPMKRIFWWKSFLFNLVSLQKFVAIVTTKLCNLWPNVFSSNDCWSYVFRWILMMSSSQGFIFDYVCVVFETWCWTNPLELRNLSLTSKNLNLLNLASRWKVSLTFLPLKAFHWHVQLEPFVRKYRLSRVSFVAWFEV